MDLFVPVSKPYIERGISSCRKCPVALALIDLLIPDVEIEVLPPSVSIYYFDVVAKKRRLFVLRLPNSINDWIMGFDGRDQMNPTAFWIDVPDHLIKKPHE